MIKYVAAVGGPHNWPNPMDGDETGLRGDVVYVFFCLCVGDGGWGCVFLHRFL